MWQTKCVLPPPPRTWASRGAFPPPFYGQFIAVGSAGRRGRRRQRWWLVGRAAMAVGRCWKEDREKCRHRICRNIKTQLFGRVEIVESVVESVAFPVFFPPKSGIFGLLQCCTVVERGARERKRNSEKLPPLSLSDHAGEDAAQGGRQGARSLTHLESGRLFFVVSYELLLYCS